MKLMQTTTATLLASVLVLAISGCDRDRSAESTGERMDNAIEDVGDSIEEMGDSINESFDNTRDNTFDDSRDNTFNDSGDEHFDEAPNDTPDNY